MSVDAGPGLSNRAIFLAALEITDDRKRHELLARACGGDSERLREIERLLAAWDAGNAGPLDKVKVPGPAETVDIETQASLELDLPSHPTIDRYKLLEQIGEGGMGSVFMAQQTQPVKRKVALKLIRPGMDSREVIARFEAERQALAMMDHPNIARVLDAGTTAEGRPYFVMELVRGIPITDYCDHERLSIDDRLRLFIDVCRAVQHAHQKGIIHRDIKPSNVMVTLHDGTPVVKVIDFGVAKALNQELTEHTLFTQFSQMIGTPLYMSPEQAEMSGLNIDTRSDVYSLGVLLYELLTGSTPFDKETLTSNGYDEMRRIIREDQAPWPSHRISTLEAHLLSTVSSHRKTDPRRLSLTMQRELDWIAMKALEKDRSRRYESASALADDVERYLEDEPVQACPPSVAYRFRKSIRRNKVALGTLSAVALALVLGILGTSWQAVRAVHAEQEAVVERNRAQEEADRAKSEASISVALNDFLSEDVLSQADPDFEPDREITLRAVLDRASAKVEESFQDQPLTEAAIRDTLAKTYMSLGIHDKAEQHLLKSLEIARRELGPEHRKTLKLKANLATTLNDLGRFEQAEKLAREVLKAQERTLGAKHEDTMNSMHNLGTFMVEWGDYAGAEAMLESVLELRRDTLGPQHNDTLATMNNLGHLLGMRGRYVEAEGRHREILASKQQSPETTRSSITASKANLASALMGQARLSEAEDILLEVVEERRELLGPRHPATLGSTQHLAVIAFRRRRYHDAEDRFREIIEVKKQVFGEEHPSVVSDEMNLAASINEQERYAEAEQILVPALEKSRRLFGSEHPTTLGCWNNLANAILGQEKLPEAEEMYRRLYEARVRTLGAQHPDTLATLNNLAFALQGQHKFANAEQVYCQAIEVLTKTLGPEHPSTRLPMVNLESLYTDWGWELSTSAEIGERHSQKAVELARKALQLNPESPNHWSKLGVALYRTGDFEESIEALDKADEMVQADSNSGTGDRAHRMFLAMAHWQLSNEETARKRYAEGAAWIAAHRSGDGKQKQFRDEAEHLLGLSEADRSELIADYYATAGIDNPRTLVERGHWYQANGDREKAIEDFTAAIRLQPDSQDGKLWRSRGIAYFDLKQYEDAVSDLSKAMELNPEDDWSLYKRGLAYQRLGHFELALDDLTKAIGAKPSDRKLHLYRAHIYRDRGEFDAALADCKKAIDFDPESDERWFRRVSAYTLRGDIYADDLQQYGNAAEEYAKVLELEPQNAAVAEKRARVLKAVEQSSSAAPDADEAASPAEPLATTAK